MPVTYAKGIAGADSERRTTMREFPLGTVERGEANRTMVYGFAASAVAAGNCTINLSTGAIGAGTGWTAETAFPAGTFGWVYRADIS